MSTQPKHLLDPQKPYTGLLIRFLGVYLIIFAFPFPFNAALSIPLALAAQILATVGVELPMLLALDDVLHHLIDSLFGLLTVPIGKILGVTVLLEPTGSGDTVHHFLKAGLTFVFALLIAFIWSRRKKGQFPRSTARWAHTWGRWWLAAIMIHYGIVKVFCQQFGTGENPHELVSTLGDYSPMHLAWVFMGHSPSYQRFAGLLELVPAILILNRKTALPGLIFLVGVLSNVFAMNLFFDIPVKLFSGHLLLTALILLIPYWPRLRALIGNKTQIPSIDLYIKPGRCSERAWSKLTFTLGSALVVASFVGARLNAAQFEKMRTPTPYVGRWDIRSTHRDDAPWQNAGTKGFKTLAIDNVGRLSLFDFEGNKHTLGIERGSTEDRLKLRHPFRRQKDVTPSIETWTVVRSETTAKSPNNQPTSMRDRENMIDVRADQITLKGHWNGHDYSIVAVRRPLPIEQPFRWLQQAPFQY